MAKTKSTTPKTKSTTPKTVELKASVNIPLAMVQSGYAGPARIERGESFECSADVARRLKASGYAT